MGWISMAAQLVVEVVKAMTSINTPSLFVRRHDKVQSMMMLLQS